MLNYKELKSEFSKILFSFSASDLQEWLEFDNQREEFKAGYNPVVLPSFNFVKIAEEKKIIK